MSSGGVIVIGIDFGTTYSGVAWSLNGVSNEIEVISAWPCGGNKTTPKVPTTISFEEDNIRWGYETGQTDGIIRGVKLLLDESKKVPYTPSIISNIILEKAGKTPVQVAGLFLKCLVAHTKAVLHRRFGEAFRGMELQYILTVPAIWSDKAKNTTLTAGLSAGIAPSQVNLISEPEAAAMHCLKAILPNTIQSQDVVIICDAGGGTVDLISYHVISVHPLCLEEATQGTGGVCGSMMLDCAFEIMLINLLGHDRYHEIPKLSREAAMDCWRKNIKLNFGSELFDENDEEGGSDCDERLGMDFFIPIPGVQDDPSIGLENGFLVIDGATVKGIFDPVVRQVDALVNSQINDIVTAGMKAKAILLVGGFGASEYLFRHLKRVHSPITVMQPQNAWSAVARGAVQSALDGNRVGKRIARCHYGIPTTVLYNALCHDRSEAFWDRREEEWKVNHRMSWHIRKGDPILEDRPIKFPFYFTCDSTAGLVGSVYLRVCHMEEAPSKVTQDVFKLCSMQYDLHAIPRESLKNSKGEEYYKVTFNVNMTPSSASLLFELEFNGLSYGAISTKY
ncbi:actin-like ATPase domain-containing protein [Aspergillus avenaceus]|uniref:Actin-like ATPase domain-containing protein n=1 Tax=Aspergillus avenaceus TaxID=36643 RepID=A0A5N6U5Y3_ASPAV|nr:actin-like ATPase domain-containing protein [Aspergillus avenaceus]